MCGGLGSGPCCQQITPSYCHGLQVDGPAGTALQAGYQDSCSGIWADLCSLYLVILPIIMERLEKFTFMQVSSCFSCQWVLWCPSPASQLLICWLSNGELQSPACFAPYLSH